MRCRLGCAGVSWPWSFAFDKAREAKEMRGMCDLGFQRWRVLRAALLAVLMLVGGWGAREGVQAAAISAGEAEMGPPKVDEWAAAKELYEACMRYGQQNYYSVKELDAGQRELLIAYLRMRVDERWGEELTWSDRVRQAHFVKDLALLGDAESLRKLVDRFWSNRDVLELMYVADARTIGMIGDGVFMEDTGWRDHDVFFPPMQECVATVVLEILRKSDAFSPAVKVWTSQVPVGEQLAAVRAWYRVNMGALKSGEFALVVPGVVKAPAPVAPALVAPAPMGKLGASLGGWSLDRTLEHPMAGPALLAMIVAGGVALAVLGQAWRGARRGW
jgi:hypothetical protein